MTSVKPVSAEQFISTFKPGDQFWYMGSLFLEPVIPEVRTLVTICLDDCYNTGKLVAKYKFASGAPGWDYIFDLTNKYHGILRSEQDALDYFAERQAAFESDAAWKAESEANKKRYLYLSNL